MTAEKQVGDSTPEIKTPDYSGLTQRQVDLLKFLHDSECCGVAPTYREIANHLGVKSLSGVTRLVNSLLERGKIERLRRSGARSIRVVYPSNTSTLVALAIVLGRCSLSAQAGVEIDKLYKAELSERGITVHGVQS